MPSVAVLDIGSNSIKILVAERDRHGQVVTLFHKALDARISAGIAQAAPRLSDEGMARGLAAIRELLADAAPYSPARTIMVATSAVRDAANGPEFTGRIHRETGGTVRILTGEEEANAIGLGLTCDPALSALQDFYVFDLGGGSLECLAFASRRVTQSASFQLGCVRLTERFIADPTAPIAPADLQRLSAHVRTTLAAGFRFGPPGIAAVATGGTATTVRAIAGAATGQGINDTPATIPVARLRALLDQLAALPLAARRQIPGLPPLRADVFPAALATLIATAEAGGIAEYRHSFYNLRYGLAAAALT